MSFQTQSVLAEVHFERIKQDEKWGEQNHQFYSPTGSLHTAKHYAGRADNWKRINATRVEKFNAMGRPKDRNCAWDGILLEEVYEALGGSTEEELRAELVQVAAVAVAMIECIDRRNANADGATR